MSVAARAPISLATCSSSCGAPSGARAVHAALDDEAPDAVETFARGCDADVVVFGTGAGAGPGGLPDGDVERSFIRCGRASVLCVRAGAPVPPDGAIVVGIDDSEASSWAMRAALRLAAAARTRLHLVHVVDAGDAIAARIGMFAAEAATADVPCTAELRHGPVAAALIAGATERFASLIAVGAPARGADPAAFFAGIAGDVVRGSRIPVLAVREPRR